MNTGRCIVRSAAGQPWSHLTGLLVFKSCKHSSFRTEHDAKPRLDCSVGRISVRGNAPATFKQDVRLGDVLNLFVRSLELMGRSGWGGLLKINGLSEHLSYVLMFVPYPAHI
jgi:hypothetical protein